VGRDSSPAADVHVGLPAKGGSWRTRADLEVCPTDYAPFPTDESDIGLFSPRGARHRIVLGYGQDDERGA
jgi:hypothetical protein